MKKVVLVAATLGWALMTSPALASGSGGGGGGFSGGSINSGISAVERLERRGRSQVRKRITCKKCEFHKRLNRQTAGEVAQAVRSGSFNLKTRDREAVLFYLNRRYGV